MLLFCRSEAKSGGWYSLAFCRSGAIIQPCQWSLMIVICLCVAALEQWLNLASGVRRLFFVCVLQVWSNYSTLSVELVLNTMLFLLGHMFQRSAPSPRLVHCPILRKVPPGLPWRASIIAEGVNQLQIIVVGSINNVQYSP